MVGVSGKDGPLNGSLSWVRKLLDNHKDIEDVTDVVGNIKSDLVPKEIFTLTPKGDVISLPTGSTVIDFAYAIHTELGHHMMGAKVNGKIVPMNYKLKTGEIVDIISTHESEKGPDREWLNVVKTSEARNKIRQWFKKECKEENILEGKAEVKLELKKNKIFVPEEELEKFLSPILEQNHCKTINDFFAAVGYGGVQLWRLMPRLKNEYSKRKKIEQRTSRKEKQFAINKNKLSPTNNSDAIIVEDMKNCFVKISKCCDPVPGDNIVGFITKGYGVSVHRCDCKNILNHSSKKEDLCRLANVSWAENILDYFDTKIEIIANNDPDFLSDVSNKLISIHLKYKSMNIKILEDNKMSLTIEAKVKNLDHLMFILKSFSHIKNILSIKRI